MGISAADVQRRSGVAMAGGRFKLGVLGVWLGLLVGCGANRYQAQSLAEGGDHEAAVLAYDRYLEEHRDDLEAARRRDASAREAYRHRLQLAATAVAERRFDAAAEELRSVHYWRGVALTPMPIDARDQWRQSFIERWIMGQVAAEQLLLRQQRRLLAARERLARRKTQLALPRLEEQWRPIERALQADITARCAAALPKATHDATHDATDAAPYLTHLALAYCAALGAPAPRSPPPLPGLAGRLDVEVEIERLEPPQRQVLRDTIAAWFAEGPWRDAGSSQVATAVVRGVVDARFSSRGETQSAAWTEMIPYLVSETHMETTTTTEHGGRTRTVSRPVSRSTLKHRPVARTHSYLALRRDGSYFASWRVELAIAAAAPPVAIDLAAHHEAHGFDHDETFAPAKLAPARAHLMSLAQWFEKARGEVAGDFRSSLEGHWGRAFCREERYTNETAARCARGAEPPPLALAQLRPIFGGDTEQVVRELTIRAR